MGKYRLYCVDQRGGINFAEWISRDTDATAVAAVRERKKNSRQCEVWQGRRLVAELGTADLRSQAK